MFGWFKKLSEPKVVQIDWEDYKGFRVAATPVAEGSQYRVCGRIEKGEGDNLKSHSFTRADLIGNLDEAKDFTLMKARLMVDQLGDSVFN